jgi:putative addiction module killer protein
MSEAKPQQLLEYLSEDGRSPFREWLRGLRDRTARARIQVRLDRLELGNFGDCRSLGDNLHELRVDHGPGYRVYIGREGSAVVILLCGGDKQAQSRDIERARSFWADYRSRST